MYDPEHGSRSESPYPPVDWRHESRQSFIAKHPKLATGLTLAAIGAGFFGAKVVDDRAHDKVWPDEKGIETSQVHNQASEHSEPPKSDIDRVGE